VEVVTVPSVPSVGGATCTEEGGGGLSFESGTVGGGGDSRGGSMGGSGLGAGVGEDPSIASRDALTTTPRRTVGAGGGGVASSPLSGRRRNEPAGGDGGVGTGAEEGLVPVDAAVVHLLEVLCKNVIKSCEFTQAAIL